MQYRAPRLSTDRTKRVAGIAAFSNQSLSSHIAFDNPTGAPSLRIGNPIATLVQSDGNTFLAVGQVNTIILGSSPLDSIVLDLLFDRSTKISYQILQLLPASSEDAPDGEYDWKWSLGFESRSIRDVAGALIYPLNPTVSNRVSGKPTYLFSSETLVTIAASIDGQLLPIHYNSAPEVGRSETFPYRHKGKACFYVEPDQRNGNGRGEFGHHFAESPFECTKCYPVVEIQKKNYQRVLEHNGAHILFDTSLLAADQPCGLCLRPFPMCSFFFQKSSGTAAARQIDWKSSTCLNPLKFQMAAATKSTEASPCTNHLILCPLQCGVVVWTYNLTAHYRGFHKLKSLDNLPDVYRMAEGEKERMEIVWNNRQNQSNTRALKKKKTKTSLTISDAHRSIMAHRRLEEEERPNMPLPTVEASDDQGHMAVQMHF
ncbi:hypothetical protein C8R47DRAFT_1222233 [Mycena vitilis]|nr:hypothetical protein C8R47DRAFT_1222233 [Mycena vitilis]